MAWLFEPQSTSPVLFTTNYGVSPRTRALRSDLWSCALLKKNTPGVARRNPSQGHWSPGKESSDPVSQLTRLPMTSFFPDVNVWLALSVATHSHSSDAWRWMRTVPGDTRLILSRYTELGLLRLLTNSVVMGTETLVLRTAWAVLDRWLEDPRVALYPDPRNVDVEFRKATKPFASQPASKWVGDCWVLASAVGNDATLVTFDRALYDLARKQGHSAALPG